MMQQFIAVVLLPCMSAVATLPGKTETVAYSCPETAHFLVREEGQFLTPQEYASKVHRTEGPRDDRMPPEVKKPEAKKKAAKKSKRKKSKRRKKQA